MAHGLLDLDRKLTQQHLNRDRHWPLRIGEVQLELARAQADLTAVLTVRQEAILTGRGVLE